MLGHSVLLNPAIEETYIYVILYSEFSDTEVFKSTEPIDIQWNLHLE